MSELLHDGCLDAGNPRVPKRTCPSCFNQLELVQLPAPSHTHDYGYSCDRRFCPNVQYFEEETHDKPLIFVREGSNGKIAHFRSAYGNVGGGSGGSGGSGGVSEEHKKCAALLRGILLKGDTLVFKAKCPKGKHYFKSNVCMPYGGNVTTEFPVGRMSLDVGVLDADGKEWFCIEVCHTHYTENNRAPLGWAECRTEESLDRLELAWKTWTKAGSVVATCCETRI